MEVLLEIKKKNENQRASHCNVLAKIIVCEVSVCNIFCSELLSIIIIIILYFNKRYIDIENLQIFHKTKRNISKTEIPILNMQYAR